MSLLNKAILRQNRQYLRSFLLILIILVVFEVLLVSVVGLHQPYWGDEAHFVKTVRQFGNEISVSQLQHYNEMSTPLPFILYAAWGHVLGFDIATLRIFSLIIALITYLVFFHLAFSIFKNPGTAILITLFLLIQPYLIGLSIFVFTDMLMMLFLILGILAVRNSRPYLFSFAAAGGLLCRQYFAFFILAAGIYFLARLVLQKNKQSAFMLISTFLSTLPLIFLFILWKGFSPQNNMKALYLNERLHFHPDFLVLYISLFAVYLFPVIIYRWRSIYGNIRILAASVLVSGIYIFFPVYASKPAVAVNVLTVGFFHRLVRAIVGTGADQFVFYAAFLLSLPVVISIIRDGWRRVGKRDFDFLFFLDLAIIGFIFLMPFSYLNWEKYFIPVIPLAALQLLLLPKRDIQRKVF